MKSRLLSGKKLILYSSICILLSTLFIQQSFAQTEQSVPYTLADRDRLIRLEEDQKSLRNEINTKFESLQNEMNTKFESLQTQINDLKTLIYFVLGSMVVLFGVMFTLGGFILWDRRTILAPVKEETYRLPSEISGGLWVVISEVFAGKEKTSEIPSHIPSEISEGNRR